MAGDSKEVARAHLADAGVEELPDDWDVVTLGDLFTEDRGTAVGVMYPGDHAPDGVTLIKAGDLNGSIINPHPDFRISRDKHHEYCSTALEGGESLRPASSILWRKGVKAASIDSGLGVARLMQAQG